MPRTVTQAEKLQQLNFSINLVFNFIHRDDILLEKLMGRRVCPKCNRNYNIAHIDRDGYFMKALLPKKNHRCCDDCGDVSLVIRDDDKENIIAERMQIYKQRTEPVLNFYKNREDTLVIDFEAKKGVDDFPKIRQLL